MTLFAVWGRLVCNAANIWSKLLVFSIQIFAILLAQFDMAGVYRSDRSLGQEQGELFSWAEAMMER